MSNRSPAIKPEFKPCVREDLAVHVSSNTTVVLSLSSLVKVLSVKVWSGKIMSMKILSVMDDRILVGDGRQNTICKGEKIHRNLYIFRNG